MIGDHREDACHAGTVEEEQRSEGHDGARDVADPVDDRGAHGAHRGGEQLR